MSDPIADIIFSTHGYDDEYARDRSIEAAAKQIRQQIGREIVDEFVRNPYKSVLVIVQEVCKMEESNDGY